MDTDEDDYPERNWSKEKQEAWDRGEERARKHRLREKFGRFGPRD
jgi:hypothetical protein